jgi:hypothetical protein
MTYIVFMKGFIPKHGGYQALLSYQKAEARLDARNTSKKRGNTLVYQPVYKRILFA